MDRSGIDELSERLAGQVIVVEPGPDKSDLEKIALGHGATVEQNAVKGRTTKYITVRICYDCTLRDIIFFSCQSKHWHKHWRFLHFRRAENCDRRQ